MANFTIHATDKIPYKLTTGLGYSIWNIAVMKAPYETGNLKSQIMLQNNGSKVKRIVYNDYNAYYLNYLEEGRGRNKRHIGFIENDTVNAILSETYLFLLTGRTTFSGVPTINFRNERARNYERNSLREIGFNLQRRISANDRATLSRIEARKHGLDGNKGFYTRNVERVNVVNRNSSENKIYYSYGKLRAK
ncbi:MAG: hypothetical protein EOM21_20685 [Gammaproteobacteria bacterium]|nr:hypothetical protein [Gammaproteobacteria bacterium]